ncbi:hypothetical protein GQ53DRAFT_862074 [Thozetella sp. PMI_491]|nr:hypothetical protein GQ53DRAFT_862074 [Thozetella sp. PMI_491]
MSTTTKEDWRLATDPTEKKRIQNRVAQRTYRNRMKQRVEELEKEIGEYQRRDQEQHNSADNSQNSGKDSHSDLVLSAEWLAQPLHMQQAQPVPPLALAPNFTTTPISASPILPPDWQWQGSTQDLYVDSLGQPSLPDSPALSDGGQQRSWQLPGGQYLLPLPPEYFSPNTDYKQDRLLPLEGEMDFGFAAKVRLPGGSSSDVTSSKSFSSMTDEGLSQEQHKAPDQSVETTPDQFQELQARSLEDRFAFIRMCVARAGFANFDDMARQYYTADFNLESDAARDQRYSRHNQLPLLLTKIRKSVKGWTQWEAHGYQSEIIKSAEGIVRAERGGTAPLPAIFAETLAELSRLHVGLADLVESGGVSKAFRPLTKMFQETMPNLWALVESLVNSDILTQRQRPYQNRKLWRS